MFSIRRWRAASALASTLLLGACSINGSFPDAPEPDAAKLRFISSMKSASLTMFDAQHCEGRNTGLLNNLFVANTRRRADMTIAPPANADAYLEVKLTPGKEQRLFLNSESACSIGFNLTPQPGAQYELTYKPGGRICLATLVRLNEVDGKVARTPVPLVDPGLSACAGTSPLFPKPLQAQPLSGERAALVDQIVEQSLTGDMKAATPSRDAVLTDAMIDASIEQRKHRMGFSLPDAYWAEYRRNVETSAADGLKVKALAVQRYKDEYRTRLSLVDTPALRELAPDSATADLSKSLAANNAMQEYYKRVTRELTKENLSQHVARMAELDKRFGVCARYAECWQN